MARWEYWVLAFVGQCFSIHVEAQVEWTFQGNQQLYSSGAQVYFELPDGSVLGSFGQDTAPYEGTTDLLELSLFAEPTVHVVPFNSTWHFLNPWALSNDLGYDLWAKPYSSTFEELGWAHVTLDEQFEVVDQTLISYPENPQSAGVRLQASNGDVVFAGMGHLLGEPLGSTSYLLLERYTQDGELVIRMYHPSIGGLLRQVVETPEGYAIAFFNFGGFGPSGFGKVLRFDHEFNYSEGFALPDVNGNASAGGQDSLVYVTGLYTMPGGNTIVAGYHDAFDGPAWHAALMKLDVDGNYVAHIAPAPPNIRSGSVQGLGLRPLSDSTFLWCYYESDVNGEVASRYQIAVVDTNLMIPRNTTFDTHYPEAAIDLFEVLPTSDGGYVVSGTTAPIPITTGIAYVAKINGTTGVAERLAPPSVALFPNPGSAFTVQLNNPMLAGSTLQVFDAQGRYVQQITLCSDRTTVDATAWSGGLYHYRITDRTGKMVHQGKWMRE